MKKILFAFLIFCSFVSEGQVVVPIGTKVSDMPIYTGNGDSVFVPTVVNGVNRKMYGRDLSKATQLTQVPSTRTVNGHPLSADVTITKADVILGNADNTSDINKPTSTAQQASIDAAINNYLQAFSYSTASGGEDTITLSAAIGKQVNNVYRSGLNIEVITVGAPTVNQVRFNSITGGLKFGYLLGAAEKVKVDYNALGFSQYTIRSVNTYAELRSFASGSNPILFIVKVDETNGNQATMYLYYNSKIIWLAGQQIN